MLPVLTFRRSSESIRPLVYRLHAFIKLLLYNIEWFYFRRRSVRGGVFGGVIHFSVQGGLFIILAALFLVVKNVCSVLALPVSTIPSVAGGRMRVIAISPALTPRRIRRLVAFPVRITVDGVVGIRRVHSISHFNLSLIAIIFGRDIPALSTHRLIGRRVRAITKRVPSRLNIPRVVPVAANLNRVCRCMLGITPKCRSGCSTVRLHAVRS